MLRFAVTRVPHDRSAVFCNSGFDPIYIAPLKSYAVLMKFVVDLSRIHMRSCALWRPVADSTKIGDAGGNEANRLSPTTNSKGSTPWAKVNLPRRADGHPLLSWSARTAAAIGLFKTQAACVADSLSTEFKH
jgi:hypothetical protein